MTTSARPALRLVTAPDGATTEVDGWVWFCGHCAAPAESAGPPAPNARVCSACGLGLLLETRREALPSSRQAFLVIDSALRVQALSRGAEKLLRLREQVAVDRPLRDLLVTANTETAEASLEQLIADALASEQEIRWAQVRPVNTFGVRMRARVAPCGPPRAVLLVLGAVRPID